MIVVKGGVQGTPGMGMLMEGLLCIQPAGHAKQLKGNLSAAPEVPMLGLSKRPNCSNWQKVQLLKNTRLRNVLVAQAVV